MKNYHTHNGKTLTIPQWAKSPENIHQVSAGCLAGRIRAGQTIAEALSRPASPRKYRYKGKNLTLTEWVNSSYNRHGLSYGALRGRTNGGMTIGQALRFPSHESRATKDHIVVKFVQANGKQYATYWQGGCFSRLGDPLPLTKARAAIIARHHGGRAVPLHQAQSA